MPPLRYRNRKRPRECCCGGAPAPASRSCSVDFRRSMRLAERGRACCKAIMSGVVIPQGYGPLGLSSEGFGTNPSVNGMKSRRVVTNLSRAIITSRIGVPARWRWATGSEFQSLLLPMLKDLCNWIATTVIAKLAASARMNSFIGCFSLFRLHASGFAQRASDAPCRCRAGRSRAITP